MSHFILRYNSIYIFCVMYYQPNEYYFVRKLYLFSHLRNIVVPGHSTSNHPKKSANLNGSDPDFDESAYIWSL